LDPHHGSHSEQECKHDPTVFHMADSLYPIIEYWKFAC
jgi:hypothetical protein